MERRWYKNVLIVDFFHCGMQIKNREWKLSDTADYFGISVGAASEAITLTSGLHQYPELWRLSRNKALKQLREVKQDVNRNSESYSSVQGNGRPR